MLSNGFLDEILWLYMWTAWDSETSPFVRWDWSVSLNESNKEHIMCWAIIQLAGIDFTWHVKSFLRPIPSRGFMHWFFSHVQSAFMMRAILQYAGMWWFRSCWRPSMARLALILAIDGKPNPRWAVGSVTMLVVSWKGNPNVLWTFPIINCQVFLHQLWELAEVTVEHDISRWCSVQQFYEWG